MRFLSVFAAVATASIIAGCGGSVPPPNDKAIKTEGAIRAASEVGARSEPGAKLYLKNAEDGLQTGKGYMAEGQNDEAGLVLDGARADAELAIALTKESASRKQALEANEKVKKLRAEAGSTKKAP